MSRNQPALPPPPELQALLVRWVLAADGAQMPRMADFALSALAAWQSHVAIIRPAVRDDPSHYLFESAGTGLIARFGRAMASKNLRNIDLALRPPLREFLGQARMNCAPRFGCSTIAQRDGRNTAWCDLVLPLYDGAMPGGRLVFASYPAGA